MSYLRTGLRGTRWLLMCAPLLGSGIALNACLSDSTTPANGDDMTTGSAGDGTATSGAGGSDNPGAGGTGSVVVGSGGAMATGVGGSGTGTGGNVGGTGGSTGAGGSGQMMTGGMTGKVAGGVRWVGRVDTSTPTAIKFNWGGSGFVASVTGTSVTVNVSNQNVTFFQPVVDGKVGTRLKAGSGMAALSVATGLAAGTHTIELYRETEAANAGITTFVSITGATLNPPPTYSGRLIECIGDSLSNGYGELGSETHPNFCATTVNGCAYTPDTQSNYMAYTAVLARALNADWSIVANSGWGLYRDNGKGLQNVMGNVYEEAYYAGQNAPPWDFSVKAQAVIINLGTNDLANGDPGMGYQTKLVELVGKIRAKYGPDAWIFPTTGSMIDSGGIMKLAPYINGAITALQATGDSKVFYVDLGTQDACGPAGTGCQYHPSVAEHKRLADKLLPTIKAKLGW